MLQSRSRFQPLSKHSFETHDALLLSLGGRHEAADPKSGKAVKKPQRKRAPLSQARSSSLPLDPSEKN